MLKIILVLGLLTLQACASVTSRPTVDANLGDGLTYYLPRKDVLVTVVVDENNVTSVSIGVTAAYPDLSRSFVLRSQRNLVGKTANNIGVNASGLLKSTKSVATSGIPDVFRNLAESIGTAQAFSAFSPTAKPCEKGTHTFVIRVSDSTPKKACGLDVVIKRLSGDTATNEGKVTARSTAAADKGAFTGIYYRQAEAYLVTVTGTTRSDAVVFSPSEAPLKRLPLSRTFFASAEADLEFEDGMPTKYNQAVEGEVVALLKLPASVISSYFSAVGSVFDAFKTRDTKQIDDLTSSIKLDLAQKKYEACLKAIREKDDAAITKLECGK